eukprot:1186400-Prorocentrum_minimum.AAC.2
MSPGCVSSAGTLKIVDLAVQPLPLHLFVLQLSLDVGHLILKLPEFEARLILVVAGLGAGAPVLCDWAVVRAAGVVRGRGLWRANDVGVEVV